MKNSERNVSWETISSWIEVEKAAGLVRFHRKDYPVVPERRPALPRRQVRHSLRSLAWGVVAVVLVTVISFRMLIPWKGNGRNFPPVGGSSDVRSFFQALPEILDRSSTRTPTIAELLPPTLGESRRAAKPSREELRKNLERAFTFADFPLESVRHQGQTRESKYLRQTIDRFFSIALKSILEETNG